MKRIFSVVVLVMVIGLSFNAFAQDFSESATTENEMRVFAQRFDVAVENFLNSYDALVRIREELGRRGEASGWMIDGTILYPIQARIGDAAGAVTTIQTAFEGAAGLRLKLEKVTNLQ